MWVRCGLAVRQVDNMARPRLLVDVTGLAFRPPHKALRQVLNRLLGSKSILRRLTRSGLGMLASMISRSDFVICDRDVSLLSLKYLEDEKLIEGSTERTQDSCE